MQINRRAFGTLAGGVVLGVLAGCDKPDAAASLLEWMRRLDGVEKAELAGAADSRYILLTLAKQRSDKDVTSLIAKVREEYAQREDEDVPRVELEIDTFRAEFYMSLPNRDEDVARVLWLRRDGRATASTYGSSGLIVTAPPAAVAGVAVGLDQVVPSDGGRRTHRVESANREVVVQWTDSPSLNFRLDRDATQHFVDLQRRFPHLTGWIEAPDSRAGVYFSAADIGLDALLKTLPTLAIARQFSELELGWGPARARYTDFAKAFTPQVRRLTADLMKIPDVIQIDLGADRPRSVTVRNGAGYVAAVASLRKGWGSYLPIDLVRRRSRFVGKLSNPVFTGSPFDTGPQYRVHVAVADVAGVTGVQVGPSAANLTIAHDITDADLTAALKAMTELPATHQINLYVSQDPDLLASAVLGQVVSRTYRPPVPTPAEVSPTLITRVTKTCARVFQP
ncbi:hypothetical protein [Kribbella sindirgiensis]|uniref:Uncharacterized protein n=1 Tax=Kribbella sindirgiensis TaxID=1124744 RepID=A0A4R0IFS0_9ACTN|nr:hypothetical protein [Kribbella sindirgiensis]TCC29738.1 hypothetical protein E0H50_25085 [Kribbella sindirgiensis]